jgi:hypothetical protein
MAATWKVVRQQTADSVEKLRFGVEPIFQSSEKTAENPRETRRTAGGERLRPEIVKRGCSLESRKL